METSKGPVADPGTPSVETLSHNTGSLPSVESNQRVLNECLQWVTLPELLRIDREKLQTAESKLAQIEETLKDFVLLSPGEDSLLDRQSRGIDGCLRALRDVVRIVRPYGCAREDIRWIMSDD